MLFGIVRVVCVVRPRIQSWCCRMAGKVKDLDDSLPNGLAAKHLFHGHALDVCSFNAMQAPDNVA